MDDLRTVGRQAHRERAWRQAAETHRVADSVGGLDPEDLAMLAEAAFLSGDATGCVQAYGRAFAGHAARGASRAAARSAIGIGQALAMKGAQAAAGGWLGRAARMLDESGEFDCAERGLLLTATEIIERQRVGPPNRRVSFESTATPDQELPRALRAPTAAERSTRQPERVLPAPCLAYQRSQRLSLAWRSAGACRSTWGKVTA